MTSAQPATVSKRVSQNIYAARRRPVFLVFGEEFELIEDAIAAERRVKGRRREKKEALIRGDFTAPPELSRRAAQRAVRASTARSARARREEGLDGIKKSLSS
jgi:hypothetical protein